MTAGTKSYHRRVCLFIYLVIIFVRGEGIGQCGGAQARIDRIYTSCPGAFAAMRWIRMDGIGMDGWMGGLYYNCSHPRSGNYERRVSVDDGHAFICRAAEDRADATTDVSMSRWACPPEHNFDCHLLIRVFRFPLTPLSVGRIQTARANQPVSPRSSQSVPHTLRVKADLGGRGKGSPALTAGGFAEDFRTVIGHWIYL